MIAVVGAGLAGLTCAKLLHEAAEEFVVLETATEPGGRVRHVRQDGFTLDRGFQVFLDSYASLRRHVDIPALQPRYFDSGALMWEDGEFFTVRSPMRHPGAIFSDLGTSAFRFADKVKLTSLVSSLILSSDAELLETCASPTDESTRAYLERMGFSDEFMRRFAQPFFGGVFIDNDLQTSKGLFWFYLKKLATGRTFVPAGGVGALPAQLAARLPDGCLRLGTTVESLETTGSRVTSLRLAGGSMLPVKSVVLATDELSTRRILGLPAPVRGHTSVSVVYLASEVPLLADKLIVLPAGDRRLVRHFVQVTNIAPEYAPAGQHLISATILNEHGLDEPALAQAVLTEITEVFPAVRGALRMIARIPVPYATLWQPAGFAAKGALPSPHPNLHLAGDQVSSSSIEATMRSGETAALAILERPL